MWLVRNKLAMGGTGTLSLNHHALARSAFHFQLKTFRKCGAWIGLVRLTPDELGEEDPQSLVEVANRIVFNLHSLLPHDDCL
jgi:hypothetical protein